MPNPTTENSHSHSHPKNGDDDPGEMVFCHQAVALKVLNSDNSTTLKPGILSIVQYRTGRWIEWRSDESSFKLENTDAEWDIVDAVRRRTCSTSSNVDNCSLIPTIRIHIANLRSYKVKEHGIQISLIDQNNDRYSFVFQADNSDGFVHLLRGFLNTRRAGRSKTTFIVVGERKEVKALKTFDDVNLYPVNRDQKETYVWNFVRNLHSRPYETTLQTFSKLSEIILYKGPEERPDEVVDLLTKSFHVDEGNKTPESDFTIIEAKKISLSPRPCFTRQKPLNIQQWTSFLDTEGRISNADAIKFIVFKGGIEPSLRQKVWKYLLKFYPWNYTSTECDQLHKEKMNEYFIMKRQWQTMTPGQEERFSGFKERKSLIEKDVNRTDRTMPFYAGDNNPNLTILSDILMTYVMYNFDIGYVQGMSDLLSPILCLMKNEVDAFWCFVGFMERVGKNFDLDQAGMKKQLNEVYLILKLIAPDLATHLHTFESNNMFFCFRWLLVLFKREFVLEDIMVLWEVLWTDLPCPNFHLLVAASILEMEKHQLMKPGNGFTEILKYVNELSMRMKLDEIFVQAEGIYYQLKDAGDKLPLDIRRIIGLASPEENDTDNSDEEAAPFNPHDSSTTKNSDDDSLADDMERVSFTNEIGFEGIERDMALNYY